MSGARAMVWKELREVFMAEGRPAVQMAFGALFSLLFGIGIPIAVGTLTFSFIGLGTWGAAGSVAVAIVAVCAFVGITGPMPTIGDAFAGERERHTLETLLASPLSDRAILWGKMAAQYLLVAAHVVLVSLAAGITSVILLGGPGLIVLPVGLLVGGLAAFVTSSFLIGVGVLMSLRAPTVKKAQERIGYVMLPFFMAPMMGSFLRFIDPVLALVLTVVGPLAIVLGAIVFNLLAFARFRRDRLVGLG